MNSTAVNGDIFITNRQGGTFAFEHLYLQIPDIHIPYDVFWGWYCLRNRNQASKWLKKLVFFCSLGVKPLIHKSELRTYAKVVPFQEKSSIHIGDGMWMSGICKYKCSNAKVPPWRFVMKISPFTAVQFILCNIPKPTYSLIYYNS
jgi:hypothetical protein